MKSQLKKRKVKKIKQTLKKKTGKVVSLENKKGAKNSKKVLKIQIKEISQTLKKKTGKIISLKKKKITQTFKKVLQVQSKKALDQQIEKVVSLKEKKITKSINPSKKAKILNLKRIKEEKIERRLILKKDLTVQERNKIIENYIPLIESITKRISSRLPANIQYCDLISSAVIGLMDAITKYDPSRNNKFKTYAEFRVRGAILDALRSQDWAPRSIRDKAKKIDKVSKELEQKLSRQPSKREIADALEVSLEEYHNMLDQTKEINIISIDESYVFSSNDKFSMLNILEDRDSSLNQIDKKNVHKIITEAIRELPERQRIVLSLYYYEEFNLKKIGDILKVTESRVSQLHAQAISRLRYKLLNRLERQELGVA
ncbi:MAG: FliA/WhiG family RNA polymerase sigma factor [Bdellovibrionales bacterium]|nr:FliA/WhiG family RNA polymerase sigma factor [Bdellovibrionales bacterium]